MQDAVSRCGDRYEIGEGTTVHEKEEEEEEEE